MSVYNSILESGGAIFSKEMKAINVIIDAIEKTLDDNKTATSDTSWYMDINETLEESGFNTLDIADKIIINFGFVDSNIDTFGEYLPQESEIINNQTKSIKVLLGINRQQHFTTFIQYKTFIRDLLLHELTHAKQDTELIKKYGPDMGVNKIVMNKSSVNYNNVVLHARNTKNKLSQIAYVIYRLFVDTEVNALCSEFYSNIEYTEKYYGVKVNKKNYETFIHKTNQGKTFFELTNTVTQLDNYSLHEFEEIMCIFFTPDFLKKKFKTTTQFVKWFKWKAYNRLEHVWKKFIQAINTYIKLQPVSNSELTVEQIKETLLNQMQHNLEMQYLKLINENVKQDDLYDVYTVRVYNKDGSLAHIYKIKQHKIDLSRNI